MPVVFLSYSSTDKFFARKLAEKLKSHGLQVWIDEAEPRVRDTLIERIAAAVTDAVTIVAVLSNTSVKSKWVRQELKQATDQEIGGRRVDVTTAVIDKCPVPDFLADKPSADFSDQDDFNGPLSKLLHVLGAARVAAAAAAVVVEPRPPETNGAHPREPEVNGVRPRVYPVAPTLEAFETIRIVGVDASRLFRPDPGRRLYHIHFELSDRPPPEWCQLFEAEREVPRHTMWRRAWVEGKYVVVHCEPEEVEACHLADLKEDVATSNQKYREHLKREADARARAATRGRTEEEVVLRMLGNLKFD